MSVQQIDRGLSQRWKDIWNYGMAGFLILQAVVLAFISFIITMTVGTSVIGWGGLCMGVALTLIGGGMYFHNQIVTFETKTNRRMEEMTAHVDKEIRRMNEHPGRYSRNKAAEPEVEDFFNPENELK